jgi:hypothetical protein
MPLKLMRCSWKGEEWLESALVVQLKKTESVSNCPGL